MKIIYHINYPNANSAERWIYESWKDGFESLGYEVLTADKFSLLNELLELPGVNVLISDVNLIDINLNFNSLQKFKEKGGKFALWVHWPLIPTSIRNKNAIINTDLVDFYYGEREDCEELFYKDTGKKYHPFPHFISTKYHHPEMPNDKLKCDILYIGTNLPLKIWFFKNVILELKKYNYNVKVIGVGWSWTDQILRSIRKLCRVLNLHSLRNYIDKKTVKIPIDEEKNYYSSAKICLNFHERAPDLGINIHLIDGVEYRAEIVNHRLFKIAGCGAFQIVDDVPAIRKYYDTNEIIQLPLEKNAWLSTIKYYLENEDERKIISNRALSKTLSKHTAEIRCKTFLKLIGI